MTFRSLSSHTLRVAAVSFVVIVGLVVSGCAGTNSPQTSGSPNSSASESGSPTPTPTPTPVYKPADAKGRAENVPVPVLPEDAKAKTKEGLEAFARYWYSTLSYAYETGDMKPLEAITSPTCTTCNSVKQSISSWHADGRWLAGGALVVQGTQSA